MYEFGMISLQITFPAQIYVLSLAAQSHCRITLCTALFPF